MSFVLRSSLGAVIFQTVYIINLDYTDPLLCNSTTLPCDIGYSVTEALMDSLICTSFQHSCHTQQTWVGTDVEDVEENILTGDKQWLGRVWIFFLNISVFKEIALGRSVCLFELFSVLDIWKRFKKRFLFFVVSNQMWARELVFCFSMLLIGCPGFSMTHICLIYHTSLLLSINAEF